MEPENGSTRAAGGGAVASVVQPARRAVSGALRSMLGNLAEALHVTNQRVDDIEERLAGVEEQLAEIAESLDRLSGDLLRVNHIAVDAGERLLPVEHLMKRIDRRQADTGPLVAKLWDETAVVRRLTTIEDLLNARWVETRTVNGAKADRSGNGD